MCLAFSKACVGSVYWDYYLYNFKLLYNGLSGLYMKTNETKVLYYEFFLLEDILKRNCERSIFRNERLLDHNGYPLWRLKDFYPFILWGKCLWVRGSVILISVLVCLNFSMSLFLSNY